MFYYIFCVDTRRIQKNAICIRGHFNFEDIFTRSVAIAFNPFQW